MSEEISDSPHMTASIRWPETRGPTHPMTLRVGICFQVVYLTTESVLSQRFSWEERDGVADSFARQGESEARADGRPMVETQIE